ncbi:MAG: hypothetical protein IIW14_00410, partial [Kiritimatiellae bacterium]|nr:hypothetical protein [Kiritimatiellia bacterium]
WLAVAGWGFFNGRQGSSVDPIYNNVINATEMDASYTYIYDGEADALPVDGFSEKDFIMVGEGNVDFKLYLAAKVRPDGGREVFVSGLDVFSNRPQAQALLNDIVEWMLH